MYYSPIQVNSTKMTSKLFLCSHFPLFFSFPFANVLWDISFLAEESEKKIGLAYYNLNLRRSFLPHLLYH